MASEHTNGPIRIEVYKQPGLLDVMREDAAAAERDKAITSSPDMRELADRVADSAYAAHGAEYELHRKRSNRWFVAGFAGTAALVGVDIGVAEITDMQHLFSSDPSPLTTLEGIFHGTMTALTMAYAGTAAFIFSKNDSRAKQLSRWWR